MNTQNADQLEMLRCALVFTAALGFSASITASWALNLLSISL